MGLAIYFFVVTTLFAQPTCAIRGTVVDVMSNRPIAGAQVFADLASEKDDSGPPVRRIADAHGAFCFEHLIPGDYFLRAEAASYLENTYGASKPGGEAEAVDVVSHKTAPPLTIKMVPSAAIGGMVTDDEGDPVSGAYITLFKADSRSRPKQVDQARTDDQGHYRFGGLQAGTYLIAATPDRRLLTSNMLYVLDENGHPHSKVQGKTYYKDAISIADATPIPIKAGQQVDGLTIAIRTAEARHVSGKLSSELLNTGLRFLYLMQRNEATIPLSVSSVPIGDDGSFAVDGLFPGPYLLEGKHVKQAIDVTNADLDGVTVEIQKPVELQLKIHPGTNPLRVREIAFLPQTGPPFGSQTAAEPQPDHTFKATLPADEYEIRVTTDALCVIDHMLINGIRQDGNLVTIKNGEPPKIIELFLAPSPK